MTRLSSVSRLSLEDFPGAPSWFEQFLQQYNDLAEDVIGRVNGGIDLSNTRWRFKDVVLDEDSETSIGDPLADLKIRPKAIIAVAAQGIDVGTDGRSGRGVYDIGLPQISWRMSGKRAGECLVTANYPLDHTKQLREMSRSSDLSIAQATPTVVTWNNTVTSRGSVITHSSGTFTVSEAGSYLVTFCGQFESATYTYQSLWIETTGGVRWGVVGSASYTGFTQLSTAWPVKLAAGATFTAVVYQTNVVPAARNFHGGTGVNDNIARVSVNRMFNDSIPRAAVRLLIMGD